MTPLFPLMFDIYISQQVEFLLLHLMTKVTVIKVAQISRAHVIYQITSQTQQHCDWQKMNCQVKLFLQWCFVIFILFCSINMQLEVLKTTCAESDMSKTETETYSFGFGVFCLFVLFLLKSGMSSMQQIVEEKQKNIHSQRTHNLHAHVKCLFTKNYHLLKVCLFADFFIHVSMQQTCHS